MVQWLVEYGDRTKTLEEIRAPELLAAIAPVQRHLAEALGAAGDEFDELKVVFSVDPEAGLKFALRGGALLVNRAVDLIGLSTELRRPS